MKRLALVLFASLVSAAEPLNEDWVAKDVAAARRIAAALPADGTKVEAFLKKLGANSTDEDREIGFHARRLRLAVYGGYTTTFVTAISWNGVVGPVEAFCHEGSPEVWKAIRDRVAAGYKDPKVDATGLRARAGHQADPEGFRRERSRVLAPPMSIDPDPAVADAYFLLWSPFSHLAYGWMQGEGGDKPEGRLAMEKLVAHEQGKSLLEDALAGPNPEGRLYAAEGLLRLEKKGGKLGESARKCIAWVRKSDVKIRVTRGCELSWEPAAGPIEEMLAVE